MTKFPADKEVDVLSNIIKTYKTFETLTFIMVPNDLGNLIDSKTLKHKPSQAKGIS